MQGGSLAGVAITRIHLEEDTASSIHDEETGETRIDYNRAGVPLMELVTEPVIKSAEQAGEFARELQLLLRYLGASEANMERGEMRVEANVSVAPKGQRSVAYVEIKNLNSFKAMERAVAYEIKRQEALLRDGGVVQKQTLGWDENKQATFPQRTKEGSADYRYFPDPDLPSLKLSEIREFNIEMLRATIAELPTQRRERYLAAGLQRDDADSFVRDARFGDFFDDVTRGKDATFTKAAGNYIANDLVKLIRDSDGRDTDLSQKISVSVDNFSKLIAMVVGGSVTSRAAKDILAVMVQGDTDPEVYAKEHNLIAVQDTGALQKTVDEVLAANPSVVADLKNGKQAALEFLLGQCMRALRGSGNPETLRGLIKTAVGL